jgi:molybdopterin converting factor small subunit
VHVTVRLFARLRDVVGAGELDREVPPGATVRTVWDDLVRDYPQIAPMPSRCPAPSTSTTRA